MKLIRRLRRLRQSSGVRELLRETELKPADLIAPVFVKDELSSPESIDSMPGILRYPLEDLVQHCKTLSDLGIPGIALFPCIDPSHKSPDGEHALDEANLMLRAIRRLKKELPELLLITDVALDPYTTHGHDGLLGDNGEILNDETVEILQKMAVLQARAGADIVAPSDMMDGRIRAIRESLDAQDLIRTLILSYSVKYASAYYGPFRDAVGSAQAAGTRKLDKRTYQLSPANPRESLLEAKLDEEEGADILMVKPAGPYLDMIQRLREQTQLPIAAYQVSGEYAQIHAAAQNGWLDLDATMLESLLAIRRSGADFILTYFAEKFARDAQS